MKAIPLVLLLGLGWLCQPCQAGVLYRCVGSQGEPAFTTTTAGYRHCRLVETFVPSRAPVSVGTGLPLGSVVSPLAPSGKPLESVRMPLPSTPPVGLPPLPEGASVPPDLLVKTGLQMPPGSSSGDRFSSRMGSSVLYRVIHADGQVEYTNVKPSVSAVALPVR